MKRRQSDTTRYDAQQLFYDAMEADDEKSAVALCRRALEINPDCADALTFLADIETDNKPVTDYIEAMRRAVEAGKRDLGPAYFKQNKGIFWGEIDSRPYMRALAALANGLLLIGQPEHLDEAIGIYEQMLELNPNDNQGVRDILAALYLQTKRYDDAAALLRRYKDDWMAVPCWARVLLAQATGDEAQAAALLKEARKQNPHVELYLTGKKRRPRSRPGYYSPGDVSEAVFCADTLWEAWKKHPQVIRWLKQASTTD